MKKFIELRFGQGFFCGEECVSKEIVSTDSIVDVFMCRPEMKSISIAYKFDGKVFKRTEFFENKCDCMIRYQFIRKALGIKGPADRFLAHGFFCADADEVHQWRESNDTGRTD